MKTKNHIKFVEHLQLSHEAIWTIAKWLWDKGYNVEIPNITVAETAKDWKKHVDNGDLFIWKDGYKKKRIEIKRVGHDFTGINDWKYKDKFIVCAKHSFDSMDEKPYAYIICSYNMENVAIVDVSSTAKNWYTEERKDFRYDNVIQNFYFCPIELVIWNKI